MVKLEGEAAEIIDYITDRLDKLKSVQKRVVEFGTKDEVLGGKIIALEDLRDWIAVEYF